MRTLALPRKAIALPSAPAAQRGVPVAILGLPVLLAGAAWVLRTAGDFRTVQAIGEALYFVSGMVGLASLPFLSVTARGPAARVALTVSMAFLAALWAWFAAVSWQSAASFWLPSAAMALLCFGFLALAVAAGVGGRTGYASLTALGGALDGKSRLGPFGESEIRVLAIAGATAVALALLFAAGEPLAAPQTLINGLVNAQFTLVVLLVLLQQLAVLVAFGPRAEAAGPWPGLLPGAVSPLHAWPIAIALLVGASATETLLAMLTPALLAALLFARPLADAVRRSHPVRIGLAGLVMLGTVLTIVRGLATPVQAASLAALAYLAALVLLEGRGAVRLLPLLAERTMTGLALLTGIVVAAALLAVALGEVGGLAWAVPVPGLPAAEVAGTVVLLAAATVLRLRFDGPTSLIALVPIALALSWVAGLMPVHLAVVLTFAVATADAFAAESRSGSGGLPARACGLGVLTMALAAVPGLATWLPNAVAFHVG
jgi:hypothetical protein